MTDPALAASGSQSHRHDLETVNLCQTVSNPVRGHQPEMVELWVAGPVLELRHRDEVGVQVG